MVNKKKKFTRRVHTSVPLISDFLLALYLHHVDRRITQNPIGEDS